MNNATFTLSSLPLPRALALWTAFVLSLASASAQIVVNSTGDGSNGYPPGFGNCDTNAFDNVIVCTLRAAIEVANGNPNVSTITFDIPTTDSGYDGKKFIIEVGRNSSNPLPDLSTDMNISGPGAAKLTVWADAGQIQITRIFTVTTAGTVSFSGLTIGQVDNFGNYSPGGVDNANNGTVNLSNCVVTGNTTKNTDSNSRAGGINNSSSGTINVTNSVVSGNTNKCSNTNSKGGGINNSTSGTINVTNSTVSGNTASDELFRFTFGGGIFNAAGTINLNKSRIINNSASGGGGGGICNFASGTVNVTNCEFSGNFSIGGGAILSEGLLNLTNSTLASNGAYGGGGAISVSVQGTSNISNCTITGNAAYGSNSQGGGIGGSGTVNVKSSVIAMNTTSGLGPDVFGSFTSKGFNLVGRKDGSTGFAAATDKKGTIKAPLDPKLDPLGLRSNGGPTQTVALLPGSPAIDKGTSVTIAGTSLTTDQRGTGFPRVQDNGAIANAAGGDGTDIGAFELQTP